MKTLIKSLAVALLFASCGEADTAIYKGGSDVNTRTYLAFTSSIYSLPIAIDDVGSLDAVVNVSSISDVDRTFAISLVPEETTADPATYNLPTSVTIPANSYQGVLTITGQDVGLEESTVLTFKIDLPEGVSSDTEKITINVQQVCPVATDKFVGDYLLQETTPFIDGPTLDHGSVVTVSIPTGTNNLRRQFTTRNYINYCTTTTMVFGFSLVCGEVIVDSGLQSTCACNGNLQFGPASVPSNYDADVDNEFFVTFTNDVFSDCGGTYQTTYKFTKQ